ncbi:MAG: hypothetical protein QNJ88_12695 [Acidimicrobiia bacterium]|nr:hypothetical protein [Acidimicrobiia bacterium]
MTVAVLIGVALSVAALLRGAWPLAAAAWVLIGTGMLLGGGAGPFVIAAGAVLLLLGGASLTRGAIYDGSPKAAFSERRPSLFKGENYEMEPDMDSVHFTHRFWGP